MIRLFIIFCFFVFGGASAFILNNDSTQAQDASNKIVVLVSKESEISEISKAELKNIFLGNEVFWSSGDRIRAAYFDVSAVAGGNPDFYKSLLGLSSTQFTNFWRRRLFSGRGIPPKSFSSESDFINYLKENKYGIGLAPETAFQARTKTNLKILKVIP